MNKITLNTVAKKVGLWICAVVFGMILLCGGKSDKVLAATSVATENGYKTAQPLSVNGTVSGNVLAGQSLWFSYTPQRDGEFLLSGIFNTLESTEIKESTMYEYKEGELYHFYEYKASWGSGWSADNGFKANFETRCTLKAGTTYYIEVILNNSGTGKYLVYLTDPTRAEGICGTNLLWSIDKNGVLTISGSGKMFDYKWCKSGLHISPWDVPPWYGKYITAIKFGSDVTHIGDYAFQYCKNVTSVKIPYGVKTIGEYAFMECTALSSVSLSDTVTDIEKLAFMYSPRLKKITIPSSVKNIGWAAVGFMPIKAENMKGSEPNPEFVISGYSGTAAEKYATENKIKFNALDKPPTPTPVPEEKLSIPKLGKVVSAGYDRLKLSWSSVKGADGYRIYVKSGKGWKTLTEVKGNVTSYIHKGLTCGSNYTYTVRAYKDTQPKKTYSSYSKTGITGKPMLSTPSIRSIKAYKTSVKMTWKPITGASGYIVYRKTGSESWKKIATIKGGSMYGYTDKKVTNGKKYTYTVKAYRAVNKKNVYSNYNKTGKSVKK